ncbi:ran-binding protein 3-like [Diaphorina citri]|uniref:Ran-binding protein 3-like n=1 Tax=Diaphorina citri TaxID=121845 RepID=A0A3Q0J0X8_DIACI|nr:ran-binding protein 3-like [Diaphorina citri]
MSQNPSETFDEPDSVSDPKVSQVTSPDSSDSVATDTPQSCVSSASENNVSCSPHSSSDTGNPNLNSTSNETPSPSVLTSQNCSVLRKSFLNQVSDSASTSENVVSTTPKFQLKSSSFGSSLLKPSALSSSKVGGSGSGFALKAPTLKNPFIKNVNLPEVSNSTEDENKASNENSQEVTSSEQVPNCNQVIMSKGLARQPTACTIWVQPTLFWKKIPTSIYEKKYVLSLFPQDSGGEDNGTTRHKSLSEAAREYEEAARACKRKYEAVAVVTGEEEEVNILQINCKLFLYDSVKTWIELGRGQLRLNDINNSLSRIVIRVVGSLRVILNTKIWAEMVVQKPSDNSVRLTAIENGQAKVYLVKVKYPNLAASRLLIAQWCPH